MAEFVLSHERRAHTMRLWHESMIPNLSRQHLLSQHREVCALKGKGWARKHATVDYVFRYPFNFLHQYHLLVIEEMEKRGYKPNQIWKNPNYRGGIIGFDNSAFTLELPKVQSPIFKEHDSDYWQSCLDNLAGKGFPTELFN